MEIEEDSDGSKPTGMKSGGHVGLRNSHVNGETYFEKSPSMAHRGVRHLARVKRPLPRVLRHCPLPACSTLVAALRVPYG